MSRLAVANQGKYGAGFLIWMPAGVGIPGARVILRPAVRLG